MIRLQIQTFVTLACVACCWPSSFVCSQPPEPKAPEKDSFEDHVAKIDAIRADPAIVNAMKPDPNDSPLRKLQKERCSERANYWLKIQTLIVIGKWNPQDFGWLLPVPARLAENLRELMEKDTDKIKCHQLQISIYRLMEKFSDTRVAVGTDPSQNTNVARATRIEAEIELLKFLATLEKPKPAPAPKNGKENPDFPPPPPLPEMDQFITDAIKPDDSPLRKLQKECCREWAIYQLKIETLTAIGKWNPQDFSDYLQNTARLPMDLLELVASPADKLKCYELGVDSRKLFETFTETRVAVGTDPAQNVCVARAERIDAEIELFKFKQAMGMPIVKPKLSEKAAKFLGRPQFFMDDEDSGTLSLKELKLDPSIANATRAEYSLRGLQKERCRERARYCNMIHTLVQIGKWNPQELAESIRVADALGKNLLELVEKPEDKIKCYQFRIGLLKGIETFTDIRVEVGTDPSQNHELAKAARIDAEIDLLKFKAEMEKLKK